MNTTMNNADDAARLTTDEAAALSQVKAWLELNADARLTWFHFAQSDHRPGTLPRAGFKRLVHPKTHEPLRFGESGLVGSELLSDYLIFSHVFRLEVCKGFDPAMVARLLHSRGHLRHTSSKDWQSQVRLPMMGATHCFRIMPSIWQDQAAELDVPAAAQQPVQTAGKAAAPVADAQQATVLLPTSEELQSWADTLKDIAGELVKDEDTASAPPTPGEKEALMPALQLQSMRLWLTGALHLRVLADAGRPVLVKDPDALPIG